MSEKIEALKKDIAELEAFANQATRTKVKDILSIEIRKLSTELIKLQEQQNAQPSAPSSASGSSTNKRYEVKLNNYAWDQSQKFVKFYVTLAKVHTVPQNVVCKFNQKSFELNVQDLENKDYLFTINHLLHEIVPEESSWKVKTDMVLITCAKSKQEHWSYVTALEKKANASKFDMESDKTKDMDPNEGLMSLMKNMYQKGDDEMKRTIAKAWTESQMKNPML